MSLLWYSVLLLGLCITLSHGYPRTYLPENPEETAGYFEGDIIPSDDSMRNGLISKVKRWPNRLVIYKISPEFDAAHRAQIQKAISILQKASCLKFQEADDTNKYYIDITAGSGGCASTVGYQQSVQRMNLQIFPIDEGCFRIGSILHEFLHSLGFYHQQSASDRDDYITIVEENIKTGMEYNFKKQSGTENFGISYDYKSVLHYSNVAFSKNGQETIITTDRNASIGQRVGLSQKDIDKLNTMYLCPVQI